MLNEANITECRRKCAEIANKQTTITYKEMGDHLGVANQTVGKYLTEIYRRECQGTKNPDLTAVVVYKETGFGAFNSEGEEAKSVKVAPNNPKDVASYRQMLKRVHARMW